MKRILLYLFLLLISAGFVAEQILIPQLNAVELSAADGEKTGESGEELLKKVEEDKLVADQAHLSFGAAVTVSLKAAYTLLPTSGIKEIPYCPPELA